MNLHQADNTVTGISWIDRLISGYLILPVALFCLWFTPLAAVVLLVLLSYGTFRALQHRNSLPLSIPNGLIFAIILIALAWTAVAGVGHIFYANIDWLMRDAVLHDLSTSGWPPGYSNESGSALILRAPVGYFLPAAAIGHFAGFGAANAALYGWTALGWSLVLISGCSLFKTNAQRLVCIMVLTFFGGMDLLGYVWGERHLPAMGEHIEWWMQYVQYSSNTTLLFWVPNHALPAWLGTLLILRHWRRPELAHLTPLLATAIPLWSPLAAIGLFPFFLFGLAWRRDFKTLFSSNTCLPFVPIALVVALYLGMDATSVPHGWMINTAPTAGAFAYRYVLFCVLEFGFLALILARLAKFDVPLRTAIAVLCLLPVYYYGPGNDLAMRASIPALTVLALATVRPLTARNSIWHAMLMLVLAIGGLGAAQEPLRALTAHSWKPRQQTLPEAVAELSPQGASFFPPHYFAQRNSHWVQLLMRKPAPVNQTKFENASSRRSLEKDPDHASN